MTIHHCADETEFVLSQIEHAQGRVFFKHRHNDNGTSLFDTFHQAADRGLNSGHLKANLKAFITKNFLNAFLKWLFGHI